MCQIVGVTKPQTSQGGSYEHYSIFPSKHFAYRNNISTFALKLTNHKYGKTMKELTKDKKKALLAEVNNPRACHVPVPCHYVPCHYGTGTPFKIIFNGLYYNK